MAGEPVAAPRELEGSLPELDDAAIAHLIEEVAADQKRNDRGRLERSLFDWYDAEQISNDAALLVTELARVLPEGDRLVDVHGRVKGPLLALSTRHLLVITKPGRDEDGANAEVVPLDRLRLLVGKHRPYVVPQGQVVDVSLPEEDHAWVSGVLAGARGGQGCLFEMLARPRRSPDALAADWYHDPTGAFVERFWDGRQWTEDGIGDAPGPLAVHPPEGPRALDDATVAHVVEGLTVAYMRHEKRDAEAAAWSEGGGFVESVEQYRHRVTKACAEIQRQFSMDDPPLDLKESGSSLLAVSARKLVVVGTVGSPPMLDAEVHERVRFRKGRLLSVDPPAVRQGVDLVVLDDFKKWRERVLAAPRAPQGLLKELLDRPRPAAGSPSPGWYPDPSGRYHERLWDGLEWAPQVTKVIGDYPQQVKDDPLR